ncbi:Serine active site containing protein 1 [Xylographa soralifera]|nr:Serine active site containing protein 1 [Xylographa soralifera]
MAEALGLAASILQIVSTGVQVSLYLYRFAETVSSAGKALKEISDDITFTTSVLEQLRTTLEAEKHHGTASKEALSTADILVRECSNVFEAIMALVKKHFPEPREGQRSIARMNSLKWPFIQPKIENLRSKLEKHKTKLILMTQVLTFAKIAASEQRNINNQIEQERQKLEALLIVSQRAKAKSGFIVNPIGLTEVFSPSEQASVDVVFVHGIFGHPKDTWTCDDADVFWPAELLPPILEDESARVLTYGYDAGADTFTDGQARHKIHDVAGRLGRDLASNRQIRKAIERPLVFIAHSLGGLVVKGVLAQSSKDQHYAASNLQSISISTYGVIFLSTPHNLLPSSINLICDMALQRSLSEISETIDRLKAKHWTLQKLNKEFLDLAHLYHICCFREMLEPKILDDLSSRLSMLHEEATGIQSNHYRMSKFSSENSPGFDLVCAAIQTCVYSAPKYIGSRWEEERMKRKLQSNVSSTNVSSSAIRRPISVPKWKGCSSMSPGSTSWSSPVFCHDSVSVTPDVLYGYIPTYPDRFGVEQIECPRDEETSDINASSNKSRNIPERHPPSLIPRTVVRISHEKKGLWSQIDDRDQDLNPFNRSVSIIGRAEDKLRENEPQAIIRQQREENPENFDASCEDSEQLRYTRQQGAPSPYLSTDNGAPQEPQLQRMATQEQGNRSSDVGSVVPIQYFQPSRLRHQESASYHECESGHDRPPELPVAPFSIFEGYSYSPMCQQRAPTEEHTLLHQDSSTSDVSQRPVDHSRQRDTDIPLRQETSFCGVHQPEPGHTVFPIIPCHTYYNSYESKKSPLPSPTQAEAIMLDHRAKPQCFDHGCNGQEFLTFSDLLRHQSERSVTATNTYFPENYSDIRTTTHENHINTSNPIKSPYDGWTDHANMNMAAGPNYGYRFARVTPENIEPNMVPPVPGMKQNYPYFDASQDMSFGASDSDNVLAQFDFDSFLQDKNDNDSHEVKSDSPSIASADLVILSPLTPILNLPQVSSSRLVGDQDSGSEDTDQPGRRYKLTGTMSNLYSNETLQVSEIEERNIVQGGLDEHHRDEHHQQRSSMMPFLPPKSDDSSKPRSRRVTLGFFKKKRIKDSPRDVFLVDQIANSQLPDLAQKYGPQNLDTRVESPNDEGKVSRGKRKREEDTQNIKSVLASAQQVQNEEVLLPELLQEAQAEIVQLVYCKRASILQEGRRVRRQSRIDRDADMSGENCEINEVVVEESLSPVQAAEGSPTVIEQIKDKSIKSKVMKRKRTRSLKLEAPGDIRSSSIDGTQATSTEVLPGYSNSAYYNSDTTVEEVNIMQSIVPIPDVQLEILDKSTSRYRRHSMDMLYDAQELNATEEEKSRAKGEIYKLLRQWTTCDPSTWTAELIHIT